MLRVIALLVALGVRCKRPESTPTTASSEPGPRTVASRGDEGSGRGKEQTTREDKTRPPGGATPTEILTGASRPELPQPSPDREPVTVHIAPPPRPAGEIDLTSLDPGLEADLKTAL